MSEVGDHLSPAPSAESLQRRQERRTLAVACGAHATHDGYTDLVYVMLPIWQAEFGLSYSEVGLLRGLFSGTLAAFQIPAGLLAEKIGTAPLLAIGTALAGFGYVVAGLSTGLVLLLVALFVGGLGASTQHPLASVLVARAFAGSRSLKALGSYNFAGDIGKMVFPATAAFLIGIVPWRPAVGALGLWGFAAAVLVLVLTPRLAAEPAPANRPGAAAGEGAPPRFGFPLLLSIGMLDSATRMGFLTYLPFLLTAKGASVQAIGLALTTVFAGGACGKLVCAFVGARIGVLATVLLTEFLTSLAIFAMLLLPLEVCYLLLPVLGIALNGTSSVLYGSVPLMVTADKRTRAFGIFYTGTIGSGALSPILYGLVGDLVGVPMALALVATLVLLTLPLALALRPALPR
jgi:MFS transporter, FSR family, fosmidomycin resistance protein